MRRLVVAFFYDKDGIIDDYYPFYLKELRKHVDTICLVSNGPLSKVSEKVVSQVADDVLIRENVGFDVGAYWAALLEIGFERLANFDEILLVNHTVYGPLFPFSEMFSAMESRECDFWGITAHKEITPNPFTKEGTLPFHINSYFIAVRRDMFMSHAFRHYWETMPEIRGYTSSILTHEAKFTEHFISLGYRCSLYMDPNEFGSDHPAHIDIDEIIARRCPVIKRRLFFHDPIFHNEYAVDLPRALDFIRSNSDYDLNLIWKNILRTAELRKLYTNAALLGVLPEVPIEGHHTASAVELRVAVCAHVYYVDMLQELLSWTNNIPGEYDFIATTDSEEKKAEIEAVLARTPRIKNGFVRVAQNRGRDVSALLITCRDFFLDDRYDAVCRLHTKKSTQVHAAQSNVFKRHLFENLLHSPGYVANLLDIFRAQRSVGVVIPPIIHIAYPTLGHSWTVNRPLAEKLAKRLKLRVPMDESTPLAAYGGMFWFRPLALRKLFAEKWGWEEFVPEPKPIDGALGHAIERLITYIAQDAGYTTHCVMTERQAATNYVALEYRLQRMSSLLPMMTPTQQIEALQRYSPPPYTSVRVAFIHLLDSIMMRRGLLAASLRALHGLYRRLRGRRVAPA